jgi:outer membrane protein assembly factor BamB
MSLVLLFASTELAAQTLRWEQQEDNGGADTATALVTYGPNVFVAANTFGGGQNIWLVEARRKSNGLLLWSDEQPVSVFDGNGQAYPVAMSANSDRLAVVGTIKGWAIRVHDADTGTVLWEDAMDVHGTASDCNLAQTVILNHQRAYVGGCVGGLPLIKVYELDGTFAWGLFAGPDTLRGSIRSLHLSGTTLLAVQSSGAVIALRASTGEIVWQTPPLPNTSISGAAFGSNKIALIGAHMGQFWFLQVLKARTGQPVCSSVGEGIATHVALHGEVYVGGGLNPTDQFTRTVVRSYDLDTCAVNWEVLAPEMTDGHEGENLINALALDPHQGLLYVGSAMLDMRARPPMGWPDLLVRAHSIVDGAVVWEIRKDGEAHLWDGALELAAGSGQLYIAGVVNKQLVFRDNADLLVEAWSTREGRRVARR